jgi:hypothetical protein
MRLPSSNHSLFLFHYDETQTLPSSSSGTIDPTLDAADLNDDLGVGPVMSWRLLLHWCHPNSHSCMFFDKEEGNRCGGCKDFDKKIDKLMA